jgi:hypothetical protein
MFTADYDLIPMSAMNHSWIPGQIDPSDIGRPPRKGSRRYLSAVRYVSSAPFN